MNTVIPLRKHTSPSSARGARNYADRLARYPELPRERRPEAKLTARIRAALERLRLRRTRV